ncbi:MAG: DUF1579 family protein [Phycisphaerales bacterium]|nr:DUF1579 family protein [Phycisphaerales bacterium]
MKRLSVSVWSMLLCSGLLAGMAVSQPAAPQPVQPTPTEPKTVQPGQPQPAPRPGQVNRQPAKVEPPADISPEMRAMLQAGAPDENHKKLEAFVGFWDGNMKMWMEPGMDPMENKTSIIGRWDSGMDGRFLAMDHRGTMMGMPFRGSATWGYNKASKRYESVWRDNFTTGMMFSTGQMSADGKGLTLSGEYDDPMGSGKVKTREVYTWDNADSFKFEFYETRAGSAESKTIEAVYTRRMSQVRPGGAGKPAGAPQPATKDGQKK